MRVERKRSTWLSVAELGVSCDPGEAGIHSGDRPNDCQSLLTTRPRMPIDVYTYDVFLSSLQRENSFPTSCLFPNRKSPLLKLFPLRVDAYI